jgi:hypothetical protein
VFESRRSAMISKEVEPDWKLASSGRFSLLNPQAVYETNSRRNAISFAMADF